MKKDILITTDKDISSSYKVKEILINKKHLDFKLIKPNAYYYIDQFNFNKKTNPLLALDYLIEANRDRKIEYSKRLEAEILETFNLLIKSTHNQERISWDDLFKKNIWQSKNEQRKIAIIILYFVSNDFQILAFPNIPTFRLMEFFNSEIPDVGKFLRVNHQEQNYAQLKYWKDFSKSIFEDWEKINLDDPEKYIENRLVLNKFFAKLKLYHNPFIRFEGYEGFPENLFLIITNFQNAVRSGNFKNAQQEISKLTSLFKKILERDSFFIRYFIFPLFFNSLNLFNDKLKEIGKPSNLTITLAERKYPFFDKYAEINLQLKVNNLGGGFANNVNFEIVFAPKIVVIAEGANKFSRHWTQLAPGTIIIEIPVRVKEEFENNLNGVFEIVWYDWEYNYKNITGEFHYECETKKVNWSVIEKEGDRYSTNPVENEEDFIGKESRIFPIYNDIKNNLASAWFFGQKRVGKTSTLLGISRELEKENTFISIPIIYGEFGHPDPTVLINNLVKRVSVKIKNSSFVDVALPELDGSLSPLLAFIESVHIKTRKKIFILIDEFDELPYEFYTLNKISQPFWQTIRAISMAKFAGLLLVGGENIQKIKITWGTSLNLLRTHKADKFDNKDEWKDYSELIRKPTQSELDFSDDAIQQIYNITGGNPFFTKLLCKVIHRQSCRRHNSYISSDEVLNAVNETVLHEADMSSFQHFIEDGLKGDETKIKQWQQLRAKFLFHASHYVNNFDSIDDLKNLKEECCIKGRISEDDFNSLNEEFQQRLIYTLKENKIIFEVPLFAKFLKIRGHILLPPFFKPDENLQIKKELEEKIRIKSDEIVALSKKWGVYQGIVITEKHIQSWFMQFEDIQTQREVFEFLKKIRFITKEDILDSVKYAYNLAHKEIDFAINKGQRMRDDIYISYLDGPGKSGAWLANQFKEVNQILKKNILELTQLKNAAQNSENPFKNMKALVLVDDFVGSGNELTKQIEDYENILVKFNTHYKIKVVLYVAFALESGREKVLEYVKTKNIPIKVYFGETFDDKEKLFSDNSRYFQNNNAEKEKMKILFQEYGNRLVNSNPLGYNDSQIAIVFPENCPNNSLPILWAKNDSKNFNWTPLFSRILG